MPSMLDSIYMANEKAKLETDAQISDMKMQRNRFVRMMDAQISKANEEKDTRKNASDHLKIQQKEEKIREDFIKKMMSEGSGTVAVGQNMLGRMNVPAEEGAGEMPILGME
jgi:cbb3-type cytochrome oxidase cytochrome c subunit